MRRLLLVVTVHWLALVAFGQSFTGDARRIGMGGVGDSENIASRMIEAQQPYRTFAIPLGLIQVIQNRHYFDPGDRATFDPVRLLEDLANPLHLTANRGKVNDLGFVRDLVNAGLNRDLNTYRGFAPAGQIEAEGLASPRFGPTITVKGSRDNHDESYHGVYVGVGPYLSLRTNFTIDEQLRQIWSATTNTYLPNRTFVLNDESSGQAALGATVGYRGRIALAGLPSDPQFNRNGLYVAANYHYLHGFRYDAADIDVRFDTDSQGLLTLRPTTVPLTIDHPYSSSGKGFAIDLGIATVVNNWQFGFGGEGIANRIEWDEMRRESFTLRSLQDGGSFVEADLANPAPIKVELPVTYSGNAGYDNGTWAALGELSHGFQGTKFHGGVERRFGPIQLRGGTRYAKERWHPAGGVGLRLTRRLFIDLAAFDTTANIERERRISMAVSLRLNRPTN